MSFASETGYVPSTIEALTDAVMNNINAVFGTDYTAETFEGTNWHKFIYALLQKVQENEIKTAEIMVKVQDYFAVTNEMISRPVTTNPGLIAAFADAGWIASVKAPVLADAGKLYVAVDVDNAAADYAAKKLAIATILKNSTVAGVVTQGTQSTAIVLSNGQSFDFKFELPNRITTRLRLTITLSSNNQQVIKSPEEVKAMLLANIAARYRMGLNFEPQKYFSTTDAPWASVVKLEWSTDGGTTWNTTVRTSAYNDLLMVSLANVELIEA